VSAPATPRWRALLWSLAALALLLAMRESIPNYNGRMAPIVERGAPGEYVAGRRFALRVDAVESARVIRFARTPSAIEQRDTSGVWLIVQASAMATHEPQLIGSAALLTRDGRRYVHSGRFPATPPLLGARELQPGVASSGVFVFELPADAVAGATLVAAANRIDLLDSELRIDLGLATAPSPRDHYDLVRR
jgi:hypothetical protein